VLKHHPDKKASSTAPTSTSAFLTGVNLNTNDDAFFKCISKAHEVLSNPEKRRQFDSVDPHFLDLEEDMPTAAETKVRRSLYLSLVFDSNSLYRVRISNFSRRSPTFSISTRVSPRFSRSLV
jgi:DnaJ family protein C protein 2